MCSRGDDPSMLDIPEPPTPPTLRCRNCGAINTALGPIASVDPRWFTAADCRACKRGTTRPKAQVVFDVIRKGATP